MAIITQIDIRNKFRKVTDQGDRPTCLSHATTGVHEYKRSNKLHLSTEYLYLISKEKNSTGLNFPNVQAALSNKGQCLEKECPQNSTNPPPNHKIPTVSKHYKYDTTIKKPAISDIEAKIKVSEPVVIGVHLTEEFTVLQKPWIIEKIPMKFLNRHALIVVGMGHKGTETYYLVRNSWGDTWGDVGHAWIARNTLQAILLQVLTFN